MFALIGPKFGIYLRHVCIFDYQLISKAEMEAFLEVFLNDSLSELDIFTVSFYR